MKNTVLTLSVLILAASCGSGAKQQDQETTAPVAPAVTEATSPLQDDREDVATAPEIQNSMLLGAIEKNDFLSPPFDSWFNSNYDNYTPGHEEMEVIKEGIPEVDKIRVYMGTWCPDSRREVPQLFKVLDLAGYDLDKVEMVAVDRGKAAPDNSHELYDIQRVPTVIFYQDGEEMNRFVEYPRETLEKDLAKIVSGQEYKHSYLY